MAAARYKGAGDIETADSFECRWLELLCAGRRLPLISMACRPAGWFASLWLLAALASAPGAGRVCAAGTLPDGLQAARDLAGVDPHRARAVLASLRDEAVRSGRLDWRLSVDEIECRVLTDMDERQAIRVADAGLAIAGGAPGGPALLPWLRLRVCRAGALVGNGEIAAGARELEEVLSASSAEELRPAHALALLELGVQDSRSGELLRGQKGLLSACEMLDNPGLERDRDLCLGHLANHYKRMGDLDEALRLLTRLRDEARARGAHWDDSIYTYGMAQVHYGLADWPQALKAFQEVAKASTVNHDTSGLIYAEHGTAATLLRMGRAREGLPRIEEALRLLQGENDPTQILQSTLVQAEIFTALGRPAESAGALQRIEDGVRARNEDVLLADWLLAMADAEGQRGRWQEAYQVLEGWRKIDSRIQKQRSSELAARLRMQFNRASDIEDVEALRRLNEQGQRLRRTQAVALGSSAVLLLLALAYALSKFRMARRLQSLASTDELTGLPNRRSLLAFGAELVRRAQRHGFPLSLLMIDVDHFKRVNDSHGHAVGDDVLRQLATALPGALRGRDRLGRFGGEEFMVLLPQASLADAAQIAERMRNAVASTPLVVAAGTLHLTVSIGVSELLPGSDSVAALLERADAALYRAKEGGRNAVALASPAESRGGPA